MFFVFLKKFKCLLGEKRCGDNYYVKLKNN